MAWIQVGTIRKSEEGKLYIKLHANQEKGGGYSSKNLKELAKALTSAGQKGISLQIEKPQDKIKRLAALGYIDDDALEGRLDSIPDWLKYEISLPPQDNND